MKRSTRPDRAVYVVWPPVWNALDPHVAVPALCGYLAREGVRVRQFDLNIEFFRYLVAEETVEEQLRDSSPVQSPRVRRAVDFVRRYYEVLRAPTAAGYQQRFSDDAEQLLLSHALEIFNACHPETTFSTLGIYHTGDIEDSDFVAEFAARDAGNPYAPFFRKTFLPEVGEELPRMVGISVCGSFQLTAAFTLARLIKEVDSEICVVVGGAFFSTLPEVLKNPKTAGNLFRHVDAFVLNEGEIPFLRLIREIMEGGGPQPGPNVYLPGRQEATHGPGCCLPADRIAAPAFSDSALKKYFRPVPRIPIEVSRGCYWGKCAFCNLATGVNERYRGIPVENIMQSLRTLPRHHPPHVLFSTLAMAPDILRSVSRRLLDDGIRLSWSAWIRPEKSLTKDDIDLFGRSGCSSLAITPESFSSNTLSRMNKGFDLDHVLRIVHWLRQGGLCDGINLIAGFPGETVDDFLATVEVCRAYGLRGEFFPFYLLKNSPIYRTPEQFGVTVRESPGKDLAFAVPFSRDQASPEGIELVGIAARNHPDHIFADAPLSGYTFDFTRSQPSKSSFPA